MQTIYLMQKDKNTLKINFEKVLSQQDKQLIEYVIVAEVSRHIRIFVTS